MTRPMTRPGLAALALLSVAGIAINAGLGAVGAWVMRRRGEA